MPGMFYMPESNCIVMDFRNTLQINKPPHNAVEVPHSAQFIADYFAKYLWESGAVPGKGEPTKMRTIAFDYNKSDRMRPQYEIVDQQIGPMCRAMLPFVTRGPALSVPIDSFPKGCTEAVIGKYNGLEVRLVTDYMLARDLLLTRVDIFQ